MCLSYYEYSYLFFLQELLNNLEQKMSVIYDERIGFEGLLAIAGLEFPGEALNSIEHYSISKSDDQKVTIQ